MPSIVIGIIAYFIFVEITYVLTLAMVRKGLMIMTITKLIVLSILWPILLIIVIIQYIKYKRRKR